MSDYASMTDAELTRAAAERVGWTDFFHVGVFPYARDPYDGHIALVPQFSHVIYDAMGLVETWIKGGIHRYYKILGESGEATVTFGDRRTGQEYKATHYGFGPARMCARGICLAYLAATEVDASCHADNPLTEAVCDTTEREPP